MKSRQQPALAFDMYGTLVDPIAIERRLCSYVGSAEAGAAMARLWREKQLEFAWRLCLMGHYRDFEWVTLKALDYIALNARVAIDHRARADLMSAYGELDPFPDVERALQELRESEYSMVVLSNGSHAMLERVMDAHGFHAYFQGVISVDEVGIYKPAPLVYQHAAMRLDRPLGDVRLVSANLFDDVGAQHAGMPAVWVNRLGEPFEGLGPEPHAVVASLTDVPKALSQTAAT